jgi:hypothetical protein
MATKGPTVHPPSDIYEHGEPWWNATDKGKLLIHPTEVSGNLASSHLVAQKLLI